MTKKSVVNNNVKIHVLVIH